MREEELIEELLKIIDIVNINELGMRMKLEEEIKKFREKEARAKIELRDVKKRLKRETEGLENRLKWVNIAGMPFIVTAFGLGLAFYKGQRAKKR